MLPDRDFLFWYQTGSVIAIFVHSGTGLTGILRTLHTRDGLEYAQPVHTVGCGKGYTLHVYSAGG